MKKDNNGALFIEAAIILPFTAVFMLLLVYMINIFIVQSVVQYSLNQTVNELGNYTYYLEYLGIIDWSTKVNTDMVKSEERRKENLDKFADALTNVYNVLDGGVDNGSFGGGGEGGGIRNNILDDTLKTADSVIDVTDIVLAYVNKPMNLFTDVLCPYLMSAKKGIHEYLGNALGKVMMYRYADDKFLTNCGVVDVNYNGLSSDYACGIAGMDFSNSSFLNSKDSRVIDIVVVYRIKFPFNASKAFNIKEGVLYDNSLCIVQRATGYGWINGDGSGSEEYNGSNIWEEK